jgi:hypothetical protein
VYRQPTVSLLQKEIVMQMYSSFSHRSKNRLLVSCLTILIGVPIMCCCLGGLFYWLFPILEQADSDSLPVLIIVGGLAVTLMMAVTGLGLFFLWFRKDRQ